jgi:hypothetical protein
LSQARGSKKITLSILKEIRIRILVSKMIKTRGELNRELMRKREIKRERKSQKMILMKMHY